VKDAPASSGGAAAEPALLDQQGCIYAPHVVALRVGQPLRIRNSDPTLHNVHVRSERNREFNLGQPIRGLESRRTFTSGEVGIDVSCDVHGWMSGVIAVFDHPYFAVSGEDGGFVLAGVPAGTYTVEAWHETLGVTSQQVTVTATGEAQVTLEFR
jgi:plastocyanin